jgi:hypothetical protein
MAFVIVSSAAGWVERFGESRKPTVVTIGNFDGVHLGHQKILSGVLERARAAELMATVLTFYPHPSRVLRPEAAPALLATLDQRLAGFEVAGLDAALVMRFDAELAKVSAEDFVRYNLVEILRARAVMVGGNFRFARCTARGRRWRRGVEFSGAGGFAGRACGRRSPAARAALCARRGNSSGDWPGSKTNCADAQSCDRAGMPAEKRSVCD